jgi:hypothetical protein
MRYYNEIIIADTEAEAIAKYKGTPFSFRKFAYEEEYDEEPEAVELKVME